MSKICPAHTEQVDAYLYVRFSTPEQAQGHSLQRQLDFGSNYANEHNLHLPSENIIIDTGNLQRGKNLHIHALMMIHPDTVKKWELVNWSNVQGNPEVIDSIKVLSFDPAKKSLPGLISYVTKGLNPRWDNETYWDFFPEKVPPQINHQMAAKPSPSVTAEIKQVEGRGSPIPKILPESLSAITPI